MTSNRSYPDRPFVGVSALVHHAGHILLTQRDKPPSEGIWTLPGGAVETGETLEDAIQRELFEETHLTIQPHHIADLVEIIRHDDSGKCVRHFVIAVFFATLNTPSLSLPELFPSDDARDAQWVKPENVRTFPLTDGTADVIDKILSSIEDHTAI